MNSYNYAGVCSYVFFGGKCLSVAVGHFSRKMVLIIFLRYRPWEVSIEKCPLGSNLGEITLARVHWEFMSITKCPWEVCRIPILTNGNSS